MLYRHAAHQRLRELSYRRDRRLPAPLRYARLQALECLSKIATRCLAFYDFPADNWKHLATTNVIESSFATVDRVRRSSGSPRRPIGLASMTRTNGRKSSSGYKFTTGNT